jgi:hypothetical protein
MTALASIIYVRKVQAQNGLMHPEVVARMVADVNECLRCRLFRTVSSVAVVEALEEYLVKGMIRESIEAGVKFPADWESDINFPAEFLWDKYSAVVASPVEGLRQMISDFVEVCEFSSTIGGELMAEYVGPADLPYDGYDLNPERIHGLTALAA